MKPADRKPIEFTANPNNPKPSPRENRQNDFLRHIAQRESINDVRALAGVTRYACEASRDRSEECRAGNVQLPKLTRREAFSVLRRSELLVQPCNCRHDGRRSGRVAAPVV